MRFELLRSPRADLGREEKIKAASSPSDIYLLPAGLTAGFVGIALSIYLKNPVAGLLLGFTIYEIIMSFGDVKARKEQDMLDDQIEIFLVELGSVAEKMPFLPGIKAVLENTPQPLRETIQDLVRKYEMGVPVEVSSANKDLKMLVELIKLKEVYGGDITGSLRRLADKAKATRDLRAEIKTGLKGSQVALVSQYGIMALIMAVSLRQQLFQDIMIESWPGKAVMVLVAAAFWGSAHYSRKVVKY